MARTPAGAHQLEAWRRRQLLAIGAAWAVPASSLLATEGLSWLGLGGLAAIAMLGGALSGLAAPGLTVVFLLRRYRARHLTAVLPALPKATLRSASVASRFP